MIFQKAIIEDADAIIDVVHRSIALTYPRYYKKEIVDFFLKHHSKESIKLDVMASMSYVLKVDDVIVGTGTMKENHITRVYVRPEDQGKGYGAYIVEQLEKEMMKTYCTANLDASAAACIFYEKLGYMTVKHDQIICENDTVLVYDIMEKNLEGGFAKTAIGMDRDQLMKDIERTREREKSYEKKKEK